MTPNSDLGFFHCFKQCSLGLGRRAVDLISEQEVGEYRPLAKPERRCLAVEDHLANNVTGHQVGGELHSIEVQRQRLGQRLHQQGFGHAGHTFDQHMAADQQSTHESGERCILAYHDLSDLGSHGQDAGAYCFVGRWFDRNRGLRYRIGFWLGWRVRQVTHRAVLSVEMSGGVCWSVVRTGIALLVPTVSKSWVSRVCNSCAVWTSSGSVATSP